MVRGNHGPGRRSAVSSQDAVFQTTTAPAPVRATCSLSVNRMRSTDDERTRARPASESKVPV